MFNNEKCPTCGRTSVDDGPIGIDTCHRPGGDVCRLVADKNSLLAAVRLLAKQKCDQATIRTVLAIVEQVDPSGHRCPRCEIVGVVANNIVKVHFAKAGDASPCDASFGSVLGGLLVAVKK